MFEPTAEQLAAVPPEDEKTRKRDAVVAETLDAEMRRRANSPD
jgi:hypothetical protein